MDLTGQLSNPPQALEDLSDQQFHPARSDDGPVRRPSATVQRRLRSDDLDRPVARYDPGMTGGELAAGLGLHRTTVSAQLQRHGRGTRRPGLTADQAVEAALLYAEGLSTARLADRYGVSANTVNAALRRQGVEIRRPGRPRRCS